MFDIDLSEDETHTGAVKKNILDGTSKWFAKIAITGIIYTLHFIDNFCVFMLFTKRVHTALKRLDIRLTYWGFPCLYFVPIGCFIYCKLQEG